MNKVAIGLVALGSLVLAGCNSDGPDEPVGPINVGPVPVFQPSQGSLPIPNDILFSGTQDLSLNLPVADPTNLSDPLVAASALDGWSTTAPFSISIGHSTNTPIEIDTRSASAGDAIRIFEVAADNRFNAQTQTPPTFFPLAVVRELSSPQDYVLSPSGSSVAVIPTRPLTPQTSYIVVVTNELEDDNGNPALPSTEYAVAKSSDDLSTGPFAALAPVQTLVNQYETLAASAGVDRDSIVLSFQFTTQSVGAVVETAKAAYIDFPLSQGAPPVASLTATGLTTNLINPALPGVAEVATGSLTLNYYLDAPLAADDAGTPGDERSPLRVLNGFFKGAAQVPGPGGAPVPNPFAGVAVNYVNALPGVSSLETVPVLATLPRAALGCVKPAEGYPVVIFQHGITSNRTALFGIGDSLAAPGRCVAAVAIDLPLHGVDASAAPFFTGYTPGGLRERTFGVDLLDNATGAPGPDSIVDGSGAHFINLTNLLGARDNNRQAVLDLLTLERALAVMDVDGDTVPDFDTSNVSYIGHSLGGIVGSSFIAYSETIQTAVLANPGSGIAGLLDASQTFGPVVRGGVAASAGVQVGSPEFAALYPQFLFGAQTVIDSADPANTAPLAIANNVPTLMLRTEGDTVVPNNSPTAPLSGTDPHAALLGLTPVVPDPNAGNVSAGGRQISLFNTGTHSTFLSPAGPGGATEFLNVTTEMQTQAISFILSGGTAVQVVDASLID